MLFNSIEYLFVFLPLAVAGFHLARFMSGAQAAIGVLIIASLVFYGSWKPIYLILLVASICTNFVVGQSVLRLGDRQLRWLIAAAGITVNLLLLGYFKYSSFVVTNLAAAFGTGWVIERIILPLGISFFTFQQIAYLVDCYKRDVARHGFLEYALLVTLFPHLIAGPITQPRHVLEQFASKDFGRVSFDLMVQGIILFSIGLAKKVLLADNLALYATPVFDSAAAGNGIRFFEGWIGALAFTFQLYFDFSGYSDMALGAALFFGIYLPVNFHSPYKATSIIEFWRRWHITLSEFLRRYLYIPLGGSREGAVRHYRNLIIVMLLGGIWHGAGWTFVIWGLCHGLLLAANHGFRALVARGFSVPAGRAWTLLCWGITFLSVAIAWVPFRAESVEAAWRIVVAMLGGNGIALSPRIAVLLPFGIAEQGFVHIAVGASWLGYVTLEALPLILLAMAICFLGPASIDLVNYQKGALLRLQRFSYAAGIAFGLLFLVAVLVVAARSTSEFLYYQF